MSILAICCNRQQAEQEAVLKPKYSEQNWTIIFGIQLVRTQV